MTKAPLVIKKCYFYTDANCKLDSPAGGGGCLAMFSSTESALDGFTSGFDGSRTLRILSIFALSWSRALFSAESGLLQLWMALISWRSTEFLAFSSANRQISGTYMSRYSFSVSYILPSLYLCCVMKALLTYLIRTADAPHKASKMLYEHYYRVSKGNAKKITSYWFRSDCSLVTCLYRVLYILALAY